MCSSIEAQRLDILMMEPVMKEQEKRPDKERWKRLVKLEQLGWTWLVKTEQRGWTRLVRME